MNDNAPMTTSGIAKHESILQHIHEFRRSLTAARPMVDYCNRCREGKMLPHKGKKSTQDDRQAIKLRHSYTPLLPVL